MKWTLCESDQPSSRSRGTSPKVFASGRLGGEIAGDTPAATWNAEHFTVDVEVGLRVSYLVPDE
jgi:hypothetical protein